jgi:hypothetical protein
VIGSYAVRFLREDRTIGSKPGAGYYHRI